MAELPGGSRISVIAIDQLEPMQILETVDSEDVLSDRMDKLVAYWRANDAPAGAVYDVENLEFDPLKINQEVCTFQEMLLRDRVNQAARAVTLAFASGTDLDAVASRYPGGCPRLALVDDPRLYSQYPEDWESDDRYRRRVWLSANLLSPHGVFEAYIFWALTADPTLRDATAMTVPGSGNITVTIMASGSNPIPTQAQLTAVYNYIQDKSRRGFTDVVQVGPPKQTNTRCRVRYWLYPGYDKDMVEEELYTAFDALIEKQWWLGYDHTRMAIDTVMGKNSAVYKTIIDEPVKDVTVDANGLVKVTAVELTYVGRGE